MVTSIEPNWSTCLTFTVKIYRLNLQCWPPAVNHVDFDVPLPSATWPNEQGTTIHLAHYHIFMARTASVVYRFRAALHSEMVSLCNIAEVVRKADEELAEIIDTLPQHLQPDTSTNDEVRQLELAQPWIKWQRYDLTLVLLHLRLRINCILQEQWLSSPNPYDWARGVSIKSALSVIWINRNWDQPVSMRKQWCVQIYGIYLFTRSVLRVYLGLCRTTSLLLRSYLYTNARVLELTQMKSTMKLSKLLSSYLMGSSRRTP